MLGESSYLPSIPAKLPQGPWLIISPHPDDETFGLGGALLLAAEQGIATDVLFLTSGDKGGDEGIAAIREKEALAAAQILKVRDVSFWRLPDRSLLPCQAVIDRLADVIVSTKPACIFFPSPVEPHPDHRASSVIAWEALRKTGFSAEPWSYEISVQGPLNVLLDISPVVAHKREVMAIYASQMTQNHYIERILGLNQARAWSLPLEVSHAEAFHVWPKEDRPLNAMLLELQTHKFGMDALPYAFKGGNQDNILPENYTGKSSLAISESVCYRTEQGLSINTEIILPLVSLIVRTKNRPNFLVEALQSIAGQTWPKIEIVIVNDGGGDVSKVVEPFKTQVTAINLIQLAKSMGRSGAANQGLTHVTGDLVGFLDDDDLLQTTHVQRLVEFALQNNAKVVYSGTKVVKVNQDGTSHEITEYNIPYCSERLFFENFVPIHSLLFAKELIDNGICFDASFDFFEDWDFWLQLSQKTEFMHSPIVTAIYRLHEDASGVHQYDNSTDAYLRIYRKWLPDFSMERIFSLLRSSHQWIDDKISALQDINSKKLDEIGGKYSYAQQIVQERDAQLQELNDKLEQLGKEHSHAQKIVKERDAQLQELNDKLEQLGKEHSHAQQIIKERDAQLQKLIDDLDKIRGSVFWSAYKRLLK